VTARASSIGLVPCGEWLIIAMACITSYPHVVDWVSHTCLIGLVGLGEYAACGSTISTFFINHSPNTLGLSINRGRLTIYWRDALLSLNIQKT
jgi:hypothetical protein